MRTTMARLLLMTGLFASGFIVSCSPTAEQSGSPGRGGSVGENEQNPNDDGGSGSGGDGGSSEPTEDKAAAESFFDDKVQPAFRSYTNPRCLQCHDAPRNILDEPDAADEKIYEFSSMYALLKEGEFPNDNKLINTLLGNLPHPGTQICRSEQDELCALMIEWWYEAFGEDGAGSKIGEVREVSARGQVTGYAMDPQDESKIFQVALYLGGDRNEGTKLADVTADAQAEVNGILKSRGFSFKIPDTNITNAAEQQIWAYAVVDGEMEELVGSPLTFTAFAPKGQGEVAAFYPSNLEGCGGQCHSWSYQTLYGALIAPSPNDGGTATNNRLYNYADPAQNVPHSGGGINADLNGLRNWWECEFQNECQAD